MKNKIFYIIYDNAKTLLGALLIAILIRSLLFQPFYIPTSSMEPTLLVETVYLSQNMHMDIANILFHLVQIFPIKVFFQKCLRGEI